MDENFLRELGFTDFIPLHKVERDSKRRLSCVTLLNDHFFTILLVKQGDEWEIEKLIFDGNERYFYNIFLEKPDLKLLIEKLFL